MNKTIHKNEVFHLVQTTPKDVELFYKGKLLSTADVEYKGNRFDDLKGTPRQLLNFDASLLPPGFEYSFEHHPDGFYNWYKSATLSLEDNTVFIDYFFWNSTDVLLSSDINLFKLFIAALSRAKKAGYYVNMDKDYLTDNKDGTITVHLEPQGNLYQHYKKHLAVFKEYFQQAAADIMQNIRRKQVNTKPDKGKKKKK